MRYRIGQWLCRRGRHDLKAITGENIGVCERCGTVHPLKRGKPVAWRRMT